MAKVSFQTQSAVQGKSTKVVSLGQEETERLLELLPMLIARLRSGTLTCRRNRNQCCGISSKCWSMKTRFYSTLPVVVEVHCEQLSLLMQNTALGSKLTQISP